MLVEEIMNTGVRVASPDGSISDVAMTMCFNKISGMPVVDENNEIVGIISEKDILRAMYPDVAEFMGQGMNMGRVDFEALESEYRDLISLSVKDLMTKNVLTVTPKSPILRAVSVMCANRIRRIPVAVDNKLLGIISMGDVHKAIFHNNIKQTLNPGNLASTSHQGATLIR
jgi:CBS domain-containing protein